MSIQIQAVAKTPRRWQSETKCLNARHKGLRTAERRVRRFGRQEIAEQLETEPTPEELEYEYEKARIEAENVLVAINDEYEKAVAAARRQQREAIAALPEKIRDLVECDWYNEWYYYVA